MSEQLQILIIKRAPVCVTGEFRWLNRDAKATLPSSIAQILIDHGHAVEASECTGAFADGQCCGQGKLKGCAAEKMRERANA